MNVTAISVSDLITCPECELGESHDPECGVPKNNQVLNPICVFFFLLILSMFSDVLTCVHLVQHLNVD